MAIMAAFYPSAHATSDYNLPLDKIITGYNSTFDANTGTLTFGNAWVGSGWYWNDAPQDFSDYDYVMVDYSHLTAGMELKVKYSDNTEEFKALPVDGHQLQFSLSEIKKSGISEIYFFSLANDNNITLENVYLGTYDVTSDVNLFEGDCAITGWDPCVLVTRQQFADAHMQPGNKLVITAKATADNGYMKIMLDKGGNLAVWDAFKRVEGYNNEIVPVSKSGSKISIPLDVDIIDALCANDTQNIRIVGENTTVTKVDVVRNDSTTALERIDTGNEDMPVEYYNLQGVRIENPMSGLYIRRQGNKVTKVIL